MFIGSAWNTSELNVHAASNGFKEIVELLLAAGASNVFVNDDGRTAKEAAVNNGFVEIAELIPADPKVEL